MRSSGLTILFRDGCHSRTKSLWTSPVLRNSRCAHPVTFQSCQRNSSPLVSATQRFTGVKRARCRKPGLHPTQAASDAATAESHTTPEYVWVKSIPASSAMHGAASQWLLKCVCSCSTPEVRKTPAPVFKSQQRGPLDNKYVWGLVFQQRAHLVAAGLHLHAVMHACTWLSSTHSESHTCSHYVVDVQV